MNSFLKYRQNKRVQRLIRSLGVRNAERQLRDDGMSQREAKTAISEAKHG